MLLSPAWRQMATKHQKVWPLLVTSGELWRPCRPHLAWQHKILAWRPRAEQ
ncbi:hypothetical protein A2U01_0066995, partial [Trifolium medium]|nr:hypothetical protein [Trifolium medium]